MSLIDKLLGFLAEAKATPPGLSVLGVVAGFMWMISQRTWSAAARATGSQTGIANNPAKVTMAVTKIHFVAIFMFLLLAKFLTRRNSVAPVSREGHARRDALASVGLLRCSRLAREFLRLRGRPELCPPARSLSSWQRSLSHN